MHCFLRMEVQVTYIISSTWKWYIKSAASGSKRADIAWTSLDNWRRNNLSLILTVCILNSLHSVRVYTSINSPVFVAGSFLSEPLIHQTHLFLWYTGQPIENRKRLWYCLKFFFLQILLLRDRWRFFIIFSLLSLPKMLNWPLRWECNVTFFMEV